MSLPTLITGCMGVEGCRIPHVLCNELLQNYCNERNRTSARHLDAYSTLRRLGLPGATTTPRCKLSVLFTMPTQTSDLIRISI